MRKLIVGTDWWTDCDDAVAMRILARAHKNGEIRILGIGINACMEDSVASMDAFLQLEGVTGLPIGLDKEATDFGGHLTYQKRLAEFPHSRTNADAEDAVKMYRRLLEQADEKVEIIEVGFPQVLSGVLESNADGISEKTGLELFREKVKKVWVMAGKWDENGGREHNFCKTPRASAAAEIFCRLCPVPITFLGWEIGKDVVTGSQLKAGDHLAMVLRDHGSENGRMSWDPMLVLMALAGNESEAGYRTVKGTASVRAVDGANFFYENENGLHGYVMKTKRNEFYREWIDSLIR